MCGIGGVALLPGVSLDAKSILNQMVTTLHHRGPDGHGVWWDPSSGIGLCHTRLAILDLSDAGNQPMHSHDRSLSIVFNGEIYNWRQLRVELEAKGKVFRTHTDTEVLLELYREHGTDLLACLRGMFSFALFDHRDGTLFCARDRVGKKPFVYAETCHGFVFASEIPAVLTMPGCDTSLNHSAIAGMLLHNLRHISDPYTAYHGLRRLRPGHAILVREGRLERSWRYWNPRFDLSGPEVGIEQVRSVLEEAASLRSVADVPVGALLSGGVDSSAVVNLMARGSNEPIRTYALGFDAADEDLRRARFMANRLGCVHREFYFEPKRQLDVFQQMLRTYGEPIMLLPLVHTHELCQAIRADGVKVVMTGHGADELFYGYSGHQRTAFLTDWLRRLSGLGVLAGLVPKNHRKGPLALLAAKNGHRKAALYESFEDCTWKGVLTADARHEMKSLVSEQMEYWGEILNAADYIDESNFVALMLENTHSVTIAGDLPAMMASVEMRSPFLDQELVELSFKIHYRQKVPNSSDSSRLKLVLKKAVSDLVPAELLYAPKRGFGSGIQERDVLSGPWKTYGDELFENPSDADGLFDKIGLKDVWQKHTTRGGPPSSIVAKHFAIQLWLKGLRH